MGILKISTEEEGVFRLRLDLSASSESVGEYLAERFRERGLVARTVITHGIKPTYLYVGEKTSEKEEKYEISSISPRVCSVSRMGRRHLPREFWEYLA